MDDMALLDLGVRLRHDPLAFLTYTEMEFWRPIGYTIFSVAYLFFGLNPFPYHLFALIIQLVSALALAHLCRKLFGATSAILAFAIYMTSLAVVANLAYVCNAYQDGMAALLLFLSLSIQYRGSRAPALVKRPYFLPAGLLFTAALCKDNWAGVIPALVVVDWINYPQSKFSDRIKRLSPFAIMLSLPIIRLIISGGSPFHGVYSMYLKFNLTVDNVIWGATIPFFPNNESGIPQWLLLLFPTCFFVGAFLLLKTWSKEILLMLFLYIGMLLISSPAPLGPYIVGWMHLLPLFGVSAIILGMVVWELGQRFFRRWIAVLPGIILVTIFILGQNGSANKVIVKQVSDSKAQVNNFYSLCDLIAKYPAGSHIYVMGGGFLPGVLREHSLVEGASLTVVWPPLISRTSQLCSKDYIYGGCKYVLHCLLERIKDPDAVVISRIGPKWMDVTERIRSIDYDFDSLSDEETSEIMNQAGVW